MARFTAMLVKLFRFIKKHKIINFLILLIISSGIYYFVFRPNTHNALETTYITQPASRGIIVSSISGSGQVSASNQVELKPKTSGTVNSINVALGDKISQGEIIATMDTRQAQRKINEAVASLQIAELEMEELLAPIDKSTLIQAENAMADAKGTYTKLLMTQENELRDLTDSLNELSLSQNNNYDKALETKQKALDNLDLAFEDAFNKISDCYLDLPDIMTTIDKILHSHEIKDNERVYSDWSNDDALINTTNADLRERIIDNIKYAQRDYEIAKKNYDTNYDVYKSANRQIKDEALFILLENTIETDKTIADAIKSEINMLDLWVELRTLEDQPIFNTVKNYQTSLANINSTVNNHLSSLMNLERNIKDYQENIINADRDLAELDQSNPTKIEQLNREIEQLKITQPLELQKAERDITDKEQKLSGLLEGIDSLSLESKKLNVSQKQNSLVEAHQELDDHIITAPFDGQVATINIALGEAVSTSTSIATLITNQKIAQITLNEIDVAKIDLKQKATLTFDAVEDLSITGQVVEIDILGTVNQGVVSYNVKIAFDLQDNRIKPGMSVSATIITESKTDILSVPLSAVKSNGDNNYVEVLIDDQPQRKNITTGINNDTQIEIIEGLSENDSIITQTISTDSTTQTSQTTARPSSNNAMGGMMRIMR